MSNIPEHIARAIENFQQPNYETRHEGLAALIAAIGEKDRYGLGSHDGLCRQAIKLTDAHFALNRGQGIALLNALSSHPASFEKLIERDDFGKAMERLAKSGIPAKEGDACRWIQTLVRYNPDGARNYPKVRAVIDALAESKSESTKREAERFLKALNPVRGVRTEPRPQRTMLRRFQPEG